jgi:hypothetical protein
MKIKSPKTIIVLFAISIVVTLGSLVLINIHKPSAIIMNNYGAGRLGDQIIGYSKAKWLSYKYNIPFRLIPFTYCNSLNISNEQSYTSMSYFFNRVFYKLFGRLVWVHTEDDLVKGLATLKGPTRFVAHINTRLNEHINNNVGTNKYDNSWVISVIYELVLQHPNFGKELKKMLQPITPIDHMHLPKDRITVAVHIRKGGGFDAPLLSKQYYNEQPGATHYDQFYSSPQENLFLQYLPKNIPSSSCVLVNRNSEDKINLDKFPPEQYYVKQIQNLSDFLDNAPMYVYLFTDDQNPIQLMERFKKAINKSNIVFDCRKEKNSHDTNVLYDLYAMADFDCLIRSGSCFAYISQLLGNHTIIIYPLHLKWIDDETLFVDRVGAIIRTQESPKKKFGYA